MEDLCAAVAELQKQAACVDQQHSTAVEELQQLQQRNAKLLSANKKLSDAVASASLFHRLLNQRLDECRQRQERGRQQLRPAALRQWQVEAATNVLTEELERVRAVLAMKKTMLQEWDEQRSREGAEVVEAEKVERQQRLLHELQQRRSRHATRSTLSAATAALHDRLETIAHDTQQVENAVEQEQSSSIGPTPRGTQDAVDLKLFSATDEEMHQLHLELAGLRQLIELDKLLLKEADTRAMADNTTGCSEGNVYDDDEDIDVVGDCVSCSDRGVVLKSAAKNCSDSDFTLTTAESAATFNKVQEQQLPQRTVTTLLRKPCEDIAVAALQARLAAGQKRRSRLSEQVELLEAKLSRARRDLASRETLKDQS